VTALLTAVMRLDYRSKLIGQGYDGASVMSGKQKGVAILIQAEAPLASYLHCHAHRLLNLALVDCFKAVDVAAEFFVVVFLCRVHLFMHGGLKCRRLCAPNAESKRIAETE